MKRLTKQDGSRVLVDRNDQMHKVTQRSAGPMKHKNTEKDGAKNWTDLLQDCEFVDFDEAGTDVAISLQQQRDTTENHL